MNENSYIFCPPKCGFGCTEFDTVTDNNFGYIAGAAVGTVLSMLFSDLIYGWQSWEAVFYWMGSLPVIWCLLWMWLVADDPTKQRFITEEERLLIRNSLEDSHLPDKVGCLSFFTSAFLYLCDWLF